MSEKKIPAEMWERVTSYPMKEDKKVPTYCTYWQRVWYKYKTRKLSMIALYFIIALFVWGYFGTVLVEWMNVIGYENKKEALLTAGDIDAAEALYFIQPEQQRHPGNTNLPVLLSLYAVDDETYFYLRPEDHRIILVKNGRIEDTPVVELDYRKYKKEINGALTDEQYASIEKYLSLLKPMQQFKFYQVEDKIIYIPYYFLKEERMRLEAEANKIEDASLRLEAREAVATKLEDIKKYEVYMNGVLIQPSKVKWNARYWFGTDEYGRDIYLRIMYGARVSLTVAIVAMSISMFLGMIFGGVSGYIGGKVDKLMMGVLDLLGTVPLLIYILLLQLFFRETGIFSVSFAIGSVFWMKIAPVIRKEVMRVKSKDYILAAQTIGAGKLRVLSYHILPNLLGVLVKMAAFSMGVIVLTESIVSFIGLGISVPVASWGTMIHEVMSHSNPEFYHFIIPALLIVVSILSFNTIYNGVKYAVDVKNDR